MKIAVLVEGKTEMAFKGELIRFLRQRLAVSMPKLQFVKHDGRIPKENKLRLRVENLLASGNPPADAVIALTDVHTGTREFRDAADAKRQMREWVGGNQRFHPHAAQYEFEAWLLPYWSTIQQLAGHDKKEPGGNPEEVDHDKPPSGRIEEIFRLGPRKRTYVKARDAARILRGQGLTLALNACPELKSFVNTILTLCEGDPFP
jgi:hypothetical protein